jgi:hypothetical protein
MDMHLHVIIKQPGMQLDQNRASKLGACVRHEAGIVHPTPAGMRARPTQIHSTWKNNSLVHACGKCVR